MNEPDASAQAEHPWLPKTAPRVLVVDDRVADAFIMSCYMQQFGCPHDIAGTFADAVSYIGRKAYGAIVVDVAAAVLQAPRLAGMVREYERRTGTRPARMIAVSALAPANAPKEFLKIGMDDYLSKPCNPRALARTLGLKEFSFTERWPAENRRAFPTNDSASGYEVGSRLGRF